MKRPFHVIAHVYDGAFLIDSFAFDVEADRYHIARELAMSKLAILHGSDGDKSIRLTIHDVAANDPDRWIDHFERHEVEFL